MSYRFRYIFKDRNRGYLVSIVAFPMCRYTLHVRVMYREWRYNCCNFMSKSNHLIALLPVWGILLVVLGHSGFEEPIIQNELSWLHSWIYSFHMPLFFLISGYLFSLTNPVLEKTCTVTFVLKR